MVYEMSDDAEVEMFMELLKADAQLPGLFLFMGAYASMCVPLPLRGCFPLLTDP